MAGTLPPVVVELTANSGQFTAAMVQARGEVAALSTQGTAHLQKFSAANKAATEEVTRSASRLSVVLSLVSALFAKDSQRGFRSELRESAVAATESGGSLTALGKTAGVLGGSLLITAAASPIIARAFTAIQGPAEALDKALFGNIDEFNKVKKAAEDTAAALLKTKGAFGAAGSAKTFTDVLNQTDLLKAELTNAQQRLQNLSDTYGHFNSIVSDAATKGAAVQLKELTKAAAQSDEEQKQLTYDVKALASRLGDTNAAANDYARELQILQSSGLGLNQINDAVISSLARTADQLTSTTSSTYGLTAAVQGLLSVLGQAGHGSITAGFSTIVGDVVKDAGILANNPLLTQTQASLQKKGLNPDQIAAFLAQQKTTLSAIGSGGVGSVGGQAGLYDLNNILNPKGGGGGYSAAQAAKDSQNDALANLRARIQAESQIHPTSLAYDKQMVVAAQDTLHIARAAEKHAQSVYEHAKGEKARHAAHQVLITTMGLVNASQKDVTRLQNEGKTLALAAKRSALELNNARLEATSNMLDQATADAVHVKEAKDALALDKKNTLDYYRDLKTYNEAVATAVRDATSAAQQAKSDQAALANAKIEAGLDFSNAAAVAQAKVTEAQNTLNADQGGSLQYYQDLAALHQAIAAQAAALAQNTTATVANTAAMGGPLNQLPSYLADRITANAGAYYNRTPHAAGGGGGMTVTVTSMSGQDVLTAINAELRRNGKPPLS